MKAKLEDIEITLVHKTDKAFLFQSDDTCRQAWVPRSQCEFEPDSGLPENRWLLPCRGVVTIGHDYAMEKELV